jgi:hypothetical protein
MLYLLRLCKFVLREINCILPFIFLLLTRCFPFEFFSASPLDFIYSLTLSLFIILFYFYQWFAPMGCMVCHAMNLFFRKFCLFWWVQLSFVCLENLTFWLNLLNMYFVRNVLWLIWNSSMYVQRSTYWLFSLFWIFTFKQICFFCSIGNIKY